MMTEYTNSRGEYITVGQLIFRTTVYGIAGIVGITASYWALVFAFCL